jgi:hypothetical protein
LTAAAAVAIGGAACGDGGSMMTGAGGSGGTGGGSDTSPHPYDADNPNIQYTGRIDATNPKQPKFSLGGTSLTARFMGTGASVLIKDEYRYGKFRNYYDARIDDMTPVKLTINPTDPSMITYPVATGLPYGEHTLTVVKRTEPNIGFGFFAGLVFEGTILPPAARPVHKLEFIGDSITAGAGIDAVNGSADCASDEGYAIGFMDADKAYGPVAARALDAEYHTVGAGGIGLVRNYTTDPSKGDPRPMPQVFGLRFPQMMDTSAANTWNPASWLPDAVVVALGTNDFSPGNPDEPARPKMVVADWVAADVAFVETLRADYPSAHVFVISSPMLGDGWPLATDTSWTDQRTALGLVEDHYTAMGMNTVHKFFVTKQSGTGCGTHPNVQQQAATGTELAAFIKTTMQW